MVRLSVLIAVALLGALPGFAWCDPITTEEVAQKLLTTTVTVRSQRNDSPAQQQVAQTDRPAAQQPEWRQQANPLFNEGVTVSSGVSVRRGLVVTFNHPDAANEPEQVRYRVTLPDGEQTKAAIRVVDQYSGLSLLEIDDQTMPVLDLAESSPAVGALILTAAAAGIEKPLVSQGIVSGLDRTLTGTDLPPLMQCDVLSTDNSAGAGIADRHGKLVGVIVASPQVGQRGGWVYAVPVQHVTRLLSANTRGKVAVIKRERAVAGLSLGPGNVEGTVAVEQVVAGGPAAKAGIKPGDVVLEAQGRKIRSPFQALDLIGNRMPGDRLNFVVQQGEQKKSVDVTLGGAGAPAPGQPVHNPAPQGQADSQQPYVGPQVNVRNVGPNKYEVRSRINPPEQPLQQQAQPADNGQRRSADEVTMLRTQVEAFGRVILQLQDEIRRRQATEAENNKTVQSLRSEVDQLRRELDGARGAGGGTGGGRYGGAAPAGKATIPPAKAPAK